MTEAAGYLRDLVVKDADGQEQRMEELLKRVTLIVNIDCNEGVGVNAECEELQLLYTRFAEKGFEILAFPCDQFQLRLGESPYSGKSVREDLKLRYGVTFPIMHKVDVNGNTAHPLFIFLQKRLSGFPINAIKWDFTKFLIVDGEPVKRYAPTTPVQAIEPEVAEALGIEMPPRDDTVDTTIDSSMDTTSRDESLPKLLKTEEASYQQDIQESRLSSKLQQDESKIRKEAGEGIDSDPFNKRDVRSDQPTMPTTTVGPGMESPVQSLGPGKMYFQQSEQRPQQELSTTTYLARGEVVGADSGSVERATGSDIMSQKREKGQGLEKKQSDNEARLEESNRLLQIPHSNFEARDFEPTEQLRRHSPPENLPSSAVEEKASDELNKIEMDISNQMTATEADAESKETRKDIKTNIHRVRLERDESKQLRSLLPEQRVKSEDRYKHGDAKEEINDDTVPKADISLKSNKRKKKSKAKSSSSSSSAVMRGDRDQQDLPVEVTELQPSQLSERSAQKDLDSSVLGTSEVVPQQQDIVGSQGKDDNETTSSGTSSSESSSAEDEQEHVPRPEYNDKLTIHRDQLKDMPALTEAELVAQGLVIESDPAFSNARFDSKPVTTKKSPRRSKREKKMHRATRKSQGDEERSRDEEEKLQDIGLVDRELSADEVNDAAAMESKRGKVSGHSKMGKRNKEKEFVLGGLDRAGPQNLSHAGKRDKAHFNFDG